METKIHMNIAKIFARRWGFNFCERVSSIGQSGGIMVMWNETVNVTIKDMNKNIITTCISNHYNIFGFHVYIATLKFNTDRLYGTN